MYKYIPQAGDTEIDELKGKIRELKEQLARKNKRIHDILNTSINAYGETIKIILDRQKYE